METIVGGLTALASALLHASWQNTLVAAAAALVFRGSTRRSAAWRHNVGMVFLVAMVLVPAAQFLSCWQDARARIEGVFPPPLPADWLGGAANLFGPESWWGAAVLVSLWLLGVCLVAVRHGAGLRAIARMERSAFEVLPPLWAKRVEELRTGMGIARDVAVRLSQDVVTPCTARLLRPVIWLPLSFVTRVPADQLEALLAHELAHIARKDWLWNGVQCVIESLLFFHPAVWWLSRRIRQEREHACDDLAGAVCGDSLPLAEALAELERARHSTPRFALAAQGGPLVHRITRLLTGDPAPGRRGRRGRVAMLGGLMILFALSFAQLALTLGDQPDLMVRASTHGLLAAGDFHEITDRRFESRRFYRATVDEHGRVVEMYWEDGRQRPIDPEVRRWIENPQLHVPSSRNR